MIVKFKWMHLSKSDKVNYSNFFLSDLNTTATLEPEDEEYFDDDNHMSTAATENAG